MMTGFGFLSHPYNSLVSRHLYSLNMAGDRNILLSCLAAVLGLKVNTTIDPKTTPASLSPIICMT